MSGKFIIRLLITTVAALLASYVLSGVYIDSIGTAFILALVLAFLNNIIKPILIFFTLPITVITFGLFLIVINILIIKWAADLVRGFRVDGWWPALLFSLFISIVTSLIEGFTRVDNK